MEVATITRCISVPPGYLSQGIERDFRQLLIERFTNTCTRELGHILAIEGEPKVLSHAITRALANVTFTLEFQARVLNLRTGKTVQGVICMIYKDGIFLNVMDTQNILIPATALSAYTYNEQTQSYDSVGGSIRIGDKVLATITASQYNKGTFSCLGTLKDLSPFLQSQNGSSTRV